MKKLLMLILFMLGFFYCLFVTAQEKGYTKEEREYYKNKMKEAQEGGYRNFIIEGIIVDQDGKPLNNVEMKITKTQFTFWDQSNKTKEKVIVNNNFKITGKNLSVISVHVMKKGYYLERLSFNNAWFKGRKGAEVKGKTLIDKNVKIVLRKIGKVAKTWLYDIMLSFQKKDRGRGASFNIKAPSDNKYVQIPNVFDEKSIPQNCVYIVPDVDKNGKIETIKDDAGRHLIAKAIHLRLSDPEGGFVIYHPKEKTGDFERIIQGMREAPEKGYKKQITLNKNLLANKQARSLFFYFRANGKYGKGRIYSITNNLEEDDVDLYLFMHFNPTGSRNVTTAGGAF